MDIRCRVCGEPWDAYGIRHGDMTPREAKAFLMGLGCPSCKGHPPDPEGKPREGRLFDFLYDVTEASDEDPVELIDEALQGEVKKEKGLTWESYVGSEE
ncbi:MAG: hypothetical protein JRD89_00860 [Deltaproteobacteria bacterium]|nr:hypothetical protein [Deltaproteobacteria bacterium]